MEIHVVKRGETLWKIAQFYQSEVTQIILVNQLENPNELVVGESIVIPELDQEYVIQPGDNLWAIATGLGVTISDLIRVNGITNPNVLYVGELLELPYFPHTVQLGEYLWSIAQRYNVTISQLLQTNNLESPSLIYPGQTLRIPKQPKPSIEVNAYTTQMNLQGRQEVLALGRNFTYLSPFMYSYRVDGSLTQMQDASIIEAAEWSNTTPLLVLTNYSGQRFDSDLGATLLRNEEVQEVLITNIISTIKEKRYTGLNIDFEYLYPQDRENYNAFLRRVVARVHPEGYSVSTAVAPKEREGQKGLLYEAHDYEAHGNIVDFVVIMTYEWGWAGGEPWAIAPINKVRDVLDYAVTAIPPGKIMMGAPLYGRDWNIPWIEGTRARTVNPVQAVKNAANYGVDIQYDENYQSPFYRYTDETGQKHEVWFEDARSMQAKYDLIDEYGLRGVSFWVLGNPFPQNWPVLQDNFSVRKF